MSINGKKISTLLDTGCSGSTMLINPKLVRELELPITQLSNPIHIKLADNSTAHQPILQKSTVNLSITTSSGPTTLILHPLIFPIPYDAILGLQFFQNYNPNIDYQSNQILALNNNNNNISNNNGIIGKEIIECNTFNALSNDPTEQIYLCSITTHQPSSIPLLQNGTPALYSEYQDLFDENSQSTLPKHSKYDLSIDLTTEQLPKPSPSYPLSTKQSQHLKEYLKDALKKGWIRPSSSPLASPCFFVPKSNGKLRLCIDYRKLNAITKKNAFPIPLIDNLISQVTKAKIFTRLDLPNAYHHLRITQNDEWKTAFRCSEGHYEFRVIPFGLTNAPACFQKMMQDIFKNHLNVFVIVYLDDILIYSENEKLHQQHVNTVLDIIRKNNLTLNVKKCTFHVHELDFLGFNLTTTGINIHADTLDTLNNYPTPSSKKQLQSFLGFVNFYRRLLPNFANLTAPLFKALSDKPFKWIPPFDAYFQKIISALKSSELVRHPDPSKAFILETDASKLAMGGVLRQHLDDSLVTVAISSKQLNAAQTNYSTFDRELLAIVYFLEKYKHHLLPSPFPVTILCDHKNLTYFTSKQNLTPRQRAYADRLLPFNFKIIYTQGKDMVVSDALSRSYAPTGPAEKMQLLTCDNDGITLTQQPLIVASTLIVPDIETDTLHSKIISAQLSIPRPTLYDFENGLITHKQKIVLPKDIQLDLLHEIINKHHDSPTAGHFGIAKTLELLKRNFHFLGPQSPIHEYVSNCIICQTNKSRRHKPYGLLMPLPIPNKPWSSVSMDFITGLPIVNSFNAILQFKCRLTKMIHLVATTKSCSSDELASHFLKNVFRLHGYPCDVISDRGSQFTSQFWNSFLALTGVKRKLSTAFHPQTDGSSEVTNQVIEQYLRIYTTSNMTNWPSLLSLVEFTYNNSTNSNTKMSPFYAVYGAHPKNDFNLSIPTSTLSASAASKCRVMRDTHIQLKNNLKTSIIRYTKYANNKRIHKKFEVGNQVMLSTKYLPITSITPKTYLPKYVGPFEITEVINRNAYRIRLPAIYKRLHDVFNITMLEPFVTSSTPALPQIALNDNLEFVIEKITGHKQYKKSFKFLVHWLGSTSSPCFEKVSSLISNDNMVSPILVDYLRSANLLLDFKKLYPSYLFPN